MLRPVRASVSLPEAIPRYSARLDARFSVADLFFKKESFPFTSHQQRFYITANRNVNQYFAALEALRASWAAA